MEKKIIAILVILNFVFPAFAFADEYVLVMSKDDNVCQYMLNLYNEDLKKYGQIDYDRHNEFKVIKWEKQKSYFQSQEAKGLKEYGTLISKFDINNDGVSEIIIKDDHRAVRGIESDGLYIFREKDFNIFRDKIVISQEFADKTIGAWGWVFNKKPFEGNVYSLYELPPYKIWVDPTPAKKKVKFYYSLGGWFYFYPFIYKGKYFTSMNDRLPDTAEKWRVPEYEEDKWEVIFQFTPDNQVEDVCYLLKVCDCKKTNNGGK